ncbi:cytochrome-c peroxidase [Geoalkalibacter sp.]|uniref:cytochrome-c peroxidase n=1 Tax=Geoalkalibacter sp. TaxID=3041440 RepID=UPI00272DD0F4|nr:cytochrome c peroxidase [Geoalkalibacter sp.]
MRALVYALMLILTLVAQVPAEERLPLPKPLPELLPPPAERVELGRLLFFDRRLSGDGTISCAVCHDPEQAYADGRPLSGAYPTNKHWRNTQSLINVAYLNRFLWDGRSYTLEQQAEGPIHSSFEMNLQLDYLVEKLRETPDYPERFQQAYGSEINRAVITTALADFQRTLIVRDTPFDRYLEGDEEALSEEARQGMALFYGKAACQRCHSGPLLSDQKFHNLGVTETPELLNDPQRRVTRHFFQVQMGLERGERDPGRYAVTRNPAERGAFRTPPLRQVAQTAPYMHNGSLATLEEVIAFYMRGGGADPDKSPLMQPLALSAEEQAALLAFLHSLSGTVPVARPPQLP